MKHVSVAAFAAAFLSAALSSHAFGHATLETREAPAGSTYKAVIRIGHGCEGAATTAVRVRVPEGVIAAKPMPKPGWEVVTKEGEYAQSYDHYGEMLTHGVVEIAWTGGTLPDAWYDEFVFRARLPDAPAGTVVYFPIVQECDEGVHRWIEMPAEGQDPDDLEEPAPSVILTEKAE